MPETTYEAKKVVCPLGLEAQNIHACLNDCILYQGEIENLDSCPVCNACRYKIPRDDPGDVDGIRIKKRVPAKVMLYFSLIPRLKRLFMNKSNAKLMRWQWRKADRTFPTFANDARNIRFGLSIWPVTLCIYNLPPWFV